MHEQKTVFVGMSGGVDSSVSALLLKEAGYNVVGVFIKVWHPDFLPCNWEDERLDAMRVAATLQIPFRTLDARDAYKNQVADYFIREYAAGRTPNPDVMCNTYVKFGHFYDYAMSEGADYIATGHYASLLQEDGKTYLCASKDTEKDQTYFLWNVREEVLARSLFPVGSLTKAAVRKHAVRAALPIAEKKDSQGICFLGAVDIPEFLSHYVDLTPGNVLTPDGRVIGTHAGSVIYTIGQRHGFTVAVEENHDRPYFVIEKDSVKNTITVSHDPRKVLPGKGHLLLHSTNWIGRTPQSGEPVSVRMRYRQRLVPATLTNIGASKAEVALDSEAEFPTEGQSCVIYQESRCLGGGIIESVQ
jgi:tRNA-uridine 2-sulfurtransferase